MLAFGTFTIERTDQYGPLSMTKQIKKSAQTRNKTAGTAEYEITRKTTRQCVVKEDHEKSFFYQKKRQPQKAHITKWTTHQLSVWTAMGPDEACLFFRAYAAMAYLHKMCPRTKTTREPNQEMEQHPHNWVRKRNNNTYVNSWRLHQFCSWPTTSCHLAEEFPHGLTSSHRRRRRRRWRKENKTDMVGSRWEYGDTTNILFFSFRFIYLSFALFLCIIF